MSKAFTEAKHAVCKAILNDADIQAFMSSNFPEKTLTVRREIPPGFLPGEENLPCVGWGVATHGRDEKDIHTVEHDAVLSIFISVNGAEVVTDADGVECIEAVALMDELGGLVERVASMTLMRNGYPVVPLPYQPDDVDWTQYFMTFRLYQIREESNIS